MCGRYNLYDIVGLHDRFETENSVDIPPNYNAAPTQLMPVVTCSDNGKRHLELAHWGIPRMLGKDVVKELINTRCDKTPYFIHPKAEQTWLDTPPNNQGILERLLYPYEDGGLDIYEVSRDVNVAKNNTGDLFLPVNSK